MARPFVVLALLPVAVNGWVTDYECAAMKEHNLQSDWFSDLFTKYKGETFVLERNGWETQDIVTEIAFQLLQIRNYHPSVQLNTDVSKVFERIHSGEVDFNLELWLETAEKRSSYRKYLDCSIADQSKQGKSCALDMGPIGFHGRSGEW